MNDLNRNREIPCLIMTLNRYRHFTECVESLRRNTRSKEIRLVIALDYPLKEKHWEGYKKICEYLEQDFKEFHSVEIIKRQANLGAGKNFRDAREYLFKKYDKIICSEDDNIFSPNFCDYILKGFERYADCETVFAVCGYSYPVHWEEDSNTIVMSSTLYSAWGFGIWRDKYQRYYTEYNKAYIEKLARDRKRLMRLRRKNKNLFFYLISDIGEENIHKGDSGVSIYIADNNYKCILPKKSLVRNMGFDGSGLHYNESQQSVFSEQVIDDSPEFEYQYSDNTNEEKNMKLLNNYSDLGLLKNMRVMMEYILFRMVGISKYTWIKSTAKRILRGNR